MVFNLFGNKCPNCQSPVSSDAKFCSKCGTPLAGGVIKCGVCGTENSGDAKFCRSCGRDLSKNATPEIQRHHWARNDQDFAIRLEADDLPGMLRKGITIEPGLNALLIERGVTRGTIPAGTYLLERPEQKLWDWLTTGIPERATLLMVEVTPTELMFNLGGRFTNDPLPIGANIRMQVEVAEPGKFLTNLLKGREKLSKEDLREFLYPEVVQIADQWLREHSLKELAENPATKAQLDIALEENLKKTFQQVGLVFKNIRTVELNLEPYDKIKGTRSQMALLNMSASVELEYQKLQATTEEDKHRLEEETRLRRAQEEAELRRRWGDIQKLNILENLAEETRKVEEEESKVDLYSRMRQAVMSDKMNEVKSEADFDKFMDDVDYQKLLREKERTDLLQTWKESKEDHDRARLHLIARADVEHEYELIALQTRLKLGQDLQSVENEINIARKQADFEFEKRLKESDLALEMNRRNRQDKREDRELEAEDRIRQIDIEEREDKSDFESLKRLTDLELSKNEETRRIAREDELARAEAEQKKWREQWDAQQQKEKSIREDAILLNESLAKLGPDALIAASGLEQAKLIKELKETEILKGMSEEQILAMAAKDSPELAKAFEEKFKAASSGQSSQQMAALYERLLHEKDALLHQSIEQSDKHIQDMKETLDKAAGLSSETSRHAMDSMADMARSLGSGSHQQPPIIINTPSGAVTPAVPSGFGSQAPSNTPANKMCVQCGQFVPADSKHCEHCGHKFEGVD